MGYPSGRSHGSPPLIRPGVGCDEASRSAVRLVHVALGMTTPTSHARWNIGSFIGVTALLFILRMAWRLCRQQESTDADPVRVRPGAASAHSIAASVARLHSRAVRDRTRSPSILCFPLAGGPIGWHGGAGSLCAG